MEGTFHLSFFANDFDATQKFYEEVLGCHKGRKNDSWVDIQFFGHQLTIHRSEDSSRVSPIDHFGIILDKDEWHELSDRLAAAKIDYVLPPSSKNSESEIESGKYIVKDPTGNILEFKYYSESIHPVRSYSA